MRFWRIPDVVKEKGICKSKIYKLLAEGKLRGRKNGTRTLIEGPSLDAYLDSLPTAQYRAPSSGVRA